MPLSACTESKRESCLEELSSRRVVLVTGKGGVGKTTVAGALASTFARSGKRVLAAEVASDGQQPSLLAEALGGTRSGDEPVPVTAGIRGVLLTPSKGHLRFLQDTLPMRLLADAAMRSSAMRRFLGAAPAFGEMGVLYRMLDLLRQVRPDGSPEHEVCVVDLPATGHALALTQLPEVILKIIPGGPIGRAVREGLAVLTDPRQTTTLVVTLPETLPVSEAIELVFGLRSNKVPLFAAVANRNPVDPFSADERAQVERLNRAQGPLFGSRAVRRMDRARLAIERLRQGQPLPVLALPELLSKRGVELTGAVAEVVAAEWSAAARQLEAVP